MFKGILQFKFTTIILIGLKNFSCHTPIIINFLLELPKSTQISCDWEGEDSETFGSGDWGLVELWECGEGIGALEHMNDCCKY